MRIVDAHHHLWDPRAIHYDLIDGKGRLAPLAKPFLSATFDALAAENGIAEGIAVEATSAGADPGAETRWLMDEVARSRLTRRVVAWAPTEKPEIGRHLDSLLATGGGRIVGVRRSFESVAPGFACSIVTVAGLREVAARGLTFDLVLFADRLQDATSLVRQVPEATFVLDHLGKPTIADRVPSAWKEDIAELARLPNVTAKVSGLITESATGEWTSAMLRPYLNHAIACFGWDRLMFASDWPVCELAGGYRRWLDFATLVGASASVGDQQAFFSGTADRVYRRAVLD